MEVTSTGRPRDPAIDAAVLAATRELLVEVGYQALTMARVVGRPPSSYAIHRCARRTELTIATAGAWKPATDSEVKVVIPDQRRAVS